MYEDNKFATKISPNPDAPLRPVKRSRSLPSFIRRATKLKWLHGKRHSSTGSYAHKSSAVADRDGFSRRLEDFSRTFNVPEDRVGPLEPHVRVQWVPDFPSSPSSRDSASHAASSSVDNVNPEPERVRLIRTLFSTWSQSILSLPNESQISLPEHMMVPPSKTPDYIETSEYFSRGYRRGSPVSNKMVDDGVRCFLKGDYTGAYNKYRAASLEGNCHGMHNLGVMLLYGQGLPTNFAAAKECFVHCAHRGLGPSMSQLGHIYLYGKGVQKDPAKAYYWLRQSAELGSAYAQFQLAGQYFHGTPFLTRNTRVAAEILKRSAAQDFAPALYNLGTMYLTGMGVQQDLKMAAALYKRAAKMNHPQAITNLGVMYIYGLGVRKNLSKAIALTKVASQYHVREALHNLGAAYTHGQGVDKNLAKAVNFYFQAALKGNREAEYALGCFFLRFQPEAIQESQEARYWLERAANHGHPEAESTLSSRLYQHEVPVLQLVQSLANRS